MLNRTFSVAFPILQKSWLTQKTGWPGGVRPTSSFFSQFWKIVLCFPKWLETTKKQVVTLIQGCFHKFWTILESKICKIHHFLHFLFNISIINSINQIFSIHISTQQIQSSLICIENIWLILFITEILKRKCKKWWILHIFDSKMVQNLWKQPWIRVTTCFFVVSTVYYWNIKKRKCKKWRFLHIFDSKWSKKIYENNLGSGLQLVFLWFLTIWENIRQFSKIGKKMMKLVLLHQVNLFFGWANFLQNSKCNWKSSIFFYYI